MSRSKKRKETLKTAQRRRKRRAAMNDESAAVDSQPSPGGTSAAHSDSAVVQQKLDVAGLMTKSILTVADRMPELKDSAVIGALRALADENRPQSQYTIEVYEEIKKHLDERQVSDRIRRREAADLIKVLSFNLDPEVPDQLIKYLGLIV